MKANLAEPTDTSLVLDIATIPADLTVEDIVQFVDRHDARSYIGLPEGTIFNDVRTYKKSNEYTRTNSGC